MYNSPRGAVDCLEASFNASRSIGMLSILASRSIAVTLHVCNVVVNVCSEFLSYIFDKIRYSSYKLPCACEKKIKQNHMPFRLRHHQFCYLFDLFSLILRFVSF